MFELAPPGQAPKSITQACEELARALCNVGQAIGQAISQALAGVASFFRAARAHHWARQHRQALERQIEHDQTLRWQRLDAKFTPGTDPGSIPGTRPPDPGQEEQ